MKKYHKLVRIELSESEIDLIKEIYGSLGKLLAKRSVKLKFDFISDREAQEIVEDLLD